MAVCQTLVTSEYYLGFTKRFLESDFARENSTSGKSPNNWGQHMKLQGIFLMNISWFFFLMYLSVVCIHSWLLVLVNIGSGAAFPAETLLACLSDHRNQPGTLKPTTWYPKHPRIERVIFFSCKAPNHWLPWLEVKRVWQITPNIHEKTRVFCGSPGRFYWLSNV